MYMTADATDYFSLDTTGGITFTPITPRDDGLNDGTAETFVVTITLGDYPDLSYDLTLTVMFTVRCEQAIIAPPNLTLQLMSMFTFDSAQSYDYGQLVLAETSHNSL